MLDSMGGQVSAYFWLSSVHFADVQEFFWQQNSTLYTIPFHLYLAGVSTIHKIHPIKDIPSSVASAQHNWSQFWRNQAGLLSLYPQWSLLALERFLSTLTIWNESANLITALKFIPCDRSWLVRFERGFNTTTKKLLKSHWLDID